jgi:parallel beta-helix repeat protein
MNRAVSVSLTILCLLSVSLTTGLIHVVKADGETIYIRADGSINPTTAPVSTSDNVTYLLIDNINESITVQRSNIVIDGNGYTLTPDTMNTCAFNLTNVNNVTITNATLATLPYSVTLNDQNIPGFLLVNTNDSEIISNNITGSFDDNPYLHTISLTSCFGNNVSSNRVTGVTDGIDLFNSDNNIVFNNHLEQGAFEGIGLYSSNNNTLKNNYVSDYAIIGSIGGVDVRGAFELESSNNNTLVGNEITGNTQGIQLENSDDNVLIANNVTQNVGGYTPGGPYPTYGFGIHIESSSNNTIYHNNFIGNNQIQYFDTQVPNNVETDGSPNTWDNGYPSGGNYWSNHNATNTPYVINANNTDHYPLMLPYTIPEFPSILILPLFLTATILAIIIYKKKRQENKRAPEYP